LVVIIPVVSGIVIAADSMLMMETPQGRVNCYTGSKIQIAKQPSRTVFAVTGIPIQIAGWKGVAPEDPCEYLRTATPTLNMPSVVKAHIENNDSLEALLSSMEQLRAAAVGAVNQSQISRDLAGKEMLAVVLATYEPTRRTAHVRQFSVSISPDLRAVAGPITAFDLNLEDVGQVFMVGESRWVTAHVINGIGKKFLAPETVTFLSTPRRVQELTIEQAANAATDIINAAAKTTQQVQIPTGIGGPAIRLLISEDAIPKELH
jgi:hypothetical protein